MIVNKYIDKKLRVLNMHDEEREICLMVTDQKMNVQFKSIEDERKKIYMNKKTTFIYLADINQD